MRHVATRPVKMIKGPVCRNGVRNGSVETLSHENAANPQTKSKSKIKVVIRLPIHPIDPT